MIIFIAKSIVFTPALTISGAEQPNESFVQIHSRCTENTFCQIHTSHVETESFICIASDSNDLRNWEQYSPCDF